MRPSTVLQMSRTSFLDVISPMRAKNSEVPHIKAVLKRTNLLVNAGKLLLFRKASADQTKVPCLCMQSDVDYLKPEAQRKYMEYRDGKLQIPASVLSRISRRGSALRRCHHAGGGPPPLPCANSNCGFVSQHLSWQRGSHHHKCQVDVGASCRISARSVLERSTQQSLSQWWML